MQLDEKVVSSNWQTSPAQHEPCGSSKAPKQALPSWLHAAQVRLSGSQNSPLQQLPCAPPSAVQVWLVAPHAAEQVDWTKQCAPASGVQGEMAQTAPGPHSAVVVQLVLVSVGAMQAVSPSTVAKQEQLGSSQVCRTGSPSGHVEATGQAPAGGGGVSGWQTPATQTSPGEHCKKQAPQWSGWSVMSTQVPRQLV